MLKQSLFSPARPRRAETRLFPCVELDTREAYLANMPQPVLQRETNDASRTTDKEAGLFEHPAGVCSALVLDMQAIEALLCQNGFSAAC